MLGKLSGLWCFQGLDVRWAVSLVPGSSNNTLHSSSTPVPSIAESSNNHRNLITRFGRLYNPAKGLSSHSSGELSFTASIHGCRSAHVAQVGRVAPGASNISAARISTSAGAPNLKPTTRCNNIIRAQPLLNRLTYQSL